MIVSAKERDNKRDNRDFVSFAVYIHLSVFSLLSHLYFLLYSFSQNQYKNITMNYHLMSETSWPFCGIQDSSIFHLKL